MSINVGLGISSLFATANNSSSPFQNAEDYVSYMRDPTRIVHVEWRKVRHEKSKGLTSHSWLEVHLLNGKRLRLELYADRGYTELVYNPMGTPNPRFFDPQSIVYDDRVAGVQDLARPLTANTLTSDAKEIAASKQYSLSEFNCHHFVLELWNSLVIDSLKTSHHPDRMKTGLLWGLEEAVGTWLQGFGGSLAGPQEGAAHRSERPLAETQSGPQKAGGAALGCLASGKLEAVERNSGSYNRTMRLQHFCQELQCGNIHLLETTGPMIPTGIPPQDPQSGMEPWEAECETWASAWLAGVGSGSMRIAERMNSIDLNKIVAEIFKAKSDSKQGYSSFASLGSMNSMASLSSSLTSDAARVMSREPQADACFVALRGKEVRLAIYAVLRPPSAPNVCAWRLLLLSGDAVLGNEASFTYVLRDLPENSPTTKAEDLAREDQTVLQTALRTSDWRHLVPDLGHTSDQGL
eukprot:TRINITY_DN29243_c0_g1_i1.p1 TRINITY_DN29243_c0_g1~~TRINITY_DN29243_c0_g1_i1.p1  ORF type:complete len:465 (-),score=60.99 TRINITY_DN29243_c0_g1_i1:202-1596(-)